MRKLLPFIAVAAMLFSCSSEEQEQQIRELKEENQQLSSEKHVLDSIMSEISNAYGRLDSNLQNIENRKIIVSKMGEKKRLSQADKDMILSEMDTISQLMEFNRKIVATLSDKLGGEKRVQLPFDKLVMSMEFQNENSTENLELMKTELANISNDFSNLFEDYVYKEAENLEMQEQLSKQQRELEEAQKKLDMAKEKLESAYYVIGTKDELRNKGLVFKKGFFDSGEMSEDFDKSLFKKINISELKEIILDSRKADIITTHPSESYELVDIKKRVNKLVIKDSELFWSVSKFLIIEVDES